MSVLLDGGKNWDGCVRARRRLWLGLMEIMMAAFEIEKF